MEHEITRGLNDVINSLKRGDFRQDNGLPSSTEIKKVRRKSKMSQAEFADHLGVSLDTVKSWETK